MKTHEQRLYDAGQQWQTYETIIPVGHEPADVLDESYWFSHRRDLKARDQIRCEAADGSWMRVVRVMGVDEVGGRVIVVAVGDVVRFDPETPPAGYSYEFAGGAWRILQEGRASPVRSGFATAIDAAAWLRLDRGGGEGAETPRAPRPRRQQEPA